MGMGKMQGIRGDIKYWKTGSASGKRQLPQQKSFRGNAMLFARKTLVFLECMKNCIKSWGKITKGLSGECAAGVHLYVRFVLARRIKGMETGAEKLCLIFWE